MRRPMNSQGSNQSCPEKEKAAPLPSAAFTAALLKLLRPCTVEGGSLGSHQRLGQLPMLPVAGAQLAPGDQAVGDVGRMPGWAARELWLPGASPGAEQRGHFRRPLCSPLYPEERLQLCRVQSPLGP